MMGVILFFLLGGLFGWIYGGNLLGYIQRKFGKDWHDRANAVDKAIYYIVYGVAFGLALPVFSIVGAVTLGVSQWIRRAVSWGMYIGCLIHGRIDTTKGGVEFINQLLFADKDDYLKLRSCAALSIIGGLGGVALAGGLFVAHAAVNATAPSTIIFIPLALALMGPIYWACIEISGIVTPLKDGDTRPMAVQIEDQRNDGWGYSEIVYNGYMWATIFMLGYFNV